MWHQRSTSTSHPHRLIGSELSGSAAIRSTRPWLHWHWSGRAIASFIGVDLLCSPECPPSPPSLRLFDGHWPHKCICTSHGLTIDYLRDVSIDSQQYQRPTLNSSTTPMSTTTEEATSPYTTIAMSYNHYHIKRDDNSDCNRCEGDISPSWYRSCRASTLCWWAYVQSIRKR